MDGFRVAIHIPGMGTKGRALAVGIAATIVVEMILNMVEQVGGRGASQDVRRAVWSLVLGTVVGATVIALTRVKTLERDATGVVKRLVAEEKLSEYASRHTDVTVCILDVNGLKKINDQFGHSAGDELIQEVVDRIWTLKLRDRHRLLARLGGDEFCIFAPGTSIEQLTREVNTVFVPPHRFGDWVLASGGVARTRTGSRDVLRCADLAMFRAKKHFYAEMMAGSSYGDGGVLSYDAVLDGIPTNTDSPRPKIRLRSHSDKLEQL